MIFSRELPSVEIRNAMEGFFPGVPLPPQTGRLLDLLSVETVATFPQIVSARYDISDPTQGYFFLSFSESVACPTIRVENIVFSTYNRSISVGPYSSRLISCAGPDLQFELSQTFAVKLTKETEAVARVVNVSIAPMILSRKAVVKGLVLYFPFDGGNDATKDRSGNRFVLEKFDYANNYNASNGRTRGAYIASNLTCTNSTPTPFIYETDVETAPMNQSKLDVSYITIAAWVFRKSVDDFDILSKKDSWTFGIRDGKLMSRLFFTGPTISFKGETKNNPISDCTTLRNLYQKESGKYWVQPLSSQPAVLVWCDMDSDEGGWTMVYKIQGPSVMKTTDAENIEALQSGRIVDVGSGKLDDASIRALCTEQVRVDQSDDGTICGDDGKGCSIGDNPFYFSFDDINQYADNQWSDKWCSSVGYRTDARYTSTCNTHSNYGKGFNDWSRSGSVILQLNYNDGRMGSHVKYGYSSQGSCTNSGGCNVAVWCRRQVGSRRQRRRLSSSAYITASSGNQRRGGVDYVSKSWTTSSSASQITVGQWHHVALTYASHDGKESHFLDKKLLNYRTGDFMGWPLQQNNNPILLGQGMCCGKLDEVMVYNRAITGNEIVSAFYGFVLPGTVGSQHIKVNTITPPPPPAIPQLSVALVDLYDATQSYLRLTFSVAVSCATLRVSHIKFDSISIGPDQARTIRCDNTSVVLELSEVLGRQTKTLIAANPNTVKVFVYPHIEAARDMPKNMVAYYPFDGSVPSLDRSGNNLHLHIKNITEQYNASGGQLGFGGVYQHLGTSKYGNGSNAYGVGAVVNISDVFMSAWVKPNSTDDFNILEIAGVFEMKVRNGRLTTQLSVGGTTPLKEWCAHPSWSGAVVDLPVGEWTWVGVTYTSLTGKETHYINGNAIDYTFHGTLESLPLLLSGGGGNASPLVVGRNLHQGSLMDELVLFNRALSGSEVFLTYRAFQPMRPAPLLNQTAIRITVKNLPAPPVHSPAMIAAVFDHSNQAQAYLRLQFATPIACPVLRASHILIYPVSGSTRETSLAVELSQNSFRLLKCGRFTIVFELSKRIASAIPALSQVVIAPAISSLAAIPKGLAGYWTFDNFENPGTDNSPTLYNRFASTSNVDRFLLNDNVFHGWSIIYRHGSLATCNVNSSNIHSCKRICKNKDGAVKNEVDCVCGSTVCTEATGSYCTTLDFSNSSICSKTCTGKACGAMSQYNFVMGYRGGAYVAPPPNVIGESESDVIKSQTRIIGVKKFVKGNIIDFTVSAWVKPLSGLDFEVISKNGSFSVGVVDGMLSTSLIFISGENEPRWTASPNWCGITRPIQRGVWTHLGVSFNSFTGKEVHYINGSQIDYRIHPSQSTVVQNKEPILLGVAMYSTLLDEVALFFTTLSGNEIFQVYHLFVDLNQSFMPVGSEQFATLSKLIPPPLEFPSLMTDATIDLTQVSTGSIAMTFNDSIACAAVAGRQKSVMFVFNFKEIILNDTSARLSSCSESTGSLRYELSTSKLIEFGDAGLPSKVLVQPAFPKSTIFSNGMVAYFHFDGSHKYKDTSGNGYTWNAINNSHVSGWFRGGYKHHGKSYPLRKKSGAPHLSPLAFYDLKTVKEKSWLEISQCITSDRICLSFIVNGTGPGGPFTLTLPEAASGTLIHKSCPGTLIGAGVDLVCKTSGWQIMKINCTDQSRGPTCMGTNGTVKHANDSKCQCGPITVCDSSSGMFCMLQDASNVTSAGICTNVSSTLNATAVFTPNNNQQQQHQMTPIIPDTEKYATNKLSVSSIHALNYITVGAWVRMTTITTTQNIMSKKGSWEFIVANRTLKTRLWIAKSCGKELHAWSAEPYVDTPTVIRPNVWTHVAFTYGNDGSVKHYRDGNLVGYTAVDSETTAPLVQNTNDIVLGIFVGTVDEIVIYDHAIDGNNIYAAYQGFQPHQTTVQTIKPTLLKETNKPCLASISLASVTNILTLEFDEIVKGATASYGVSPAIESFVLGIDLIVRLGIDGTSTVIDLPASTVVSYNSNTSLSINLGWDGKPTGFEKILLSFPGIVDLSGKCGSFSDLFCWWCFLFVGVFFF